MTVEGQFAVPVEGEQVPSQAECAGLGPLPGRVWLEQVSGHLVLVSEYRADVRDDRGVSEVGVPCCLPEVTLGWVFGEDRCGVRGGPFTIEVGKLGEGFPVDPADGLGRLVSGVQVPVEQVMEPGQVDSGSLRRAHSANAMAAVSACGRTWLSD